MDGQEFTTPEFRTGKLEHANKAFSKPLTAYVGQDQNPQSTCGEKPKQISQPSVPAAIRKLISELGLRYRPTSQTDIEAHTAMLALLAIDLADLPASLLDRAIAEWVTSSPFMPKAYDLVELSRKLLPPANPSAAVPKSNHELAARNNHELDMNPSGRRDIRWVADAGGVHLDWIR
jgi:hypothetical protein